MERSLNSWKADCQNHSDFRCTECGEEFHEPLLAKISSSGLTQTYYACPRCLTEVPENRAQKNEQDENHAVSFKDLNRPSSKLEGTTDCEHFLGFLGRRPKDTAIPEDCLTCEKMIECMVH
jgi:DNA-directed RNA polymerase subunit RPC12/RpoP